MEEKALVKRNQRLEPSDIYNINGYIYIYMYILYIYFYLCTDMYSMNFNKKLGPLGLEMFTLRFHSMPTTLSNSLSLSLFLSRVGNVPIRLTANHTGLGMKSVGDRSKFQQ